MKPLSNAPSWNVTVELTMHFAFNYIFKLFHYCIEVLYKLLYVNRHVFTSDGKEIPQGRANSRNGLNKPKATNNGSELLSNKVDRAGILKQGLRLKVWALFYHISGHQQFDDLNQHWLWKPDKEPVTSQQRCEWAHWCPNGLSPNTCEEMGKEER